VFRTTNHSEWPAGMVHVVPGATLQSKHRPLSPQEWASAEQVASRLHTELRRIVEAFPEHARGATGMARHLNVLRQTCQRVVSSVEPGVGGPAVLASLPGVVGLRQFLDGAEAVGVSAADVSSARAAIEQFDRLIRETGGSQSRLAARINARPAATTARGSTADDARRALFDAAVAVTGRACDTAVSIYAFRSGEGGLTLERALAKGQIGASVWPGGMPLVLSSGNTLARADRPGEIQLIDKTQPRGVTPEAILRPFTTDPLPTVTSRVGKNGLIQVIDPPAMSESAQPCEPLDIVTATRGQHPMIDPTTGRPTFDSVWSLIGSPARRLVLDVYLHVDMERDFRPTAEAHLYNPGLYGPDDDRWPTRVPAQPRLELLGRGIGNAACNSYARHAELTSFFFEHVAWDPSQFVGFRCEVAYPVWRAGYAIFFEHVARDAARAAARA
jgi:hypothetical protein